MVTIQASLGRNYDSVPSIDKRLFASPKHADQIWDSPSLVFSGYSGALFCGVKHPEHDDIESKWSCTSTPQFTLEV
jgi:hypothetical protein